MAAAAAMVGGGLLSAYGQIQAGQAAKQAAEFNAANAERNAVLVKQKAGEDEAKLRVMAGKQLGDMRASIGASGITTDGSPMEVLQDSAATAEKDALNIRHQGDLQAYAYRSDAALQRFQGASAEQGSYYGAAGTLLSAGGNAYSKMPSRS